MMKKNKQGKYGVKMTRLEPGDLRYWGSDIFQRLEQQVGDVKLLFYEGVFLHLNNTEKSWYVIILE